MFLIGFVVCLIFVIIVSLLTSKAKYQNTESVKIVEGKVNYILPDLNVVAAYKKENGVYQKIEDIPRSGYALNKDDSYCTIPNDDTPIKTMLEYSNGKLTVDITKKGTKCYLYFEEKPITNAQELLTDLKSKSNGAKTTFTGPATTDEGIFSAPDGMYGGTSYYYRGSVENNYVHFADAYWRIIRINGDGTLRLIYDGNQAYANGDSSNGNNRQIGTKTYNTDKSARKFVGFKYDSGEHGTTTASNILGNNEGTSGGSLNWWYKTNIADKGFDSKVDQNGLFCNDRNATTTESQTWDDWLDPEKNNKKDSTGSLTYYGAYMRFAGKSTATPTLNCENDLDIFSKENSTKGNKSLTYPVGLITADEVIFAGGWYGTGNSSYYLYTGNYFWTMSPYNSSGSSARVFYVYSTGYLTYINVNYTYGVRPVLNLKADTTFSSGNGSYDSPFEVG